MPDRTDTLVQMDSFFQRIRRILEEKEISQAELARSLGVGQATVSEWFTRGRVPNGHVLLRLPEVLDVNGHWLLTGEGSRVPAGNGTELHGEAVRAVLEEILSACHELQARYGIGSQA